MIFEQHGTLIALSTLLWGRGEWRWAEARGPASLSFNHAQVPPPSLFSFQIFRIPGATAPWPHSSTRPCSEVPLGIWSFLYLPRACGWVGPRDYGPRASKNLKEQPRRRRDLGVVKRQRGFAPGHLHTPLVPSVGNLKISKSHSTSTVDPIQKTDIMPMNCMNTFVLGGGGWQLFRPDPRICRNFAWWF